jgi:hypothetical protein
MICACAFAFEAGGADWTLGMLTALALLNVVLVALLWYLSRSYRLLSEL